MVVIIFVSILIRLLILTVFNTLVINIFPPHACRAGGKESTVTSQSLARLQLPTALGRCASQIPRAKATGG